MKIKSQRDFWSGLMFLVVGVAFAWGATEYSFGTSARPGPGYFPFGLGILLALLGGLVLFKALTLESEGGDPVGAIAWRPLLVIASAIAFFGFALPRLGLACTLPVLIALSALAGDEFRWRDVLISSVVLTVGSWALFILGLKLTIPLWPIYFSG
ncbi:tripartite tricarboxylate transporter TctB family protein [Roseateles sp. NT4]|uniref:tripartite tricarboxylate transporter TctB family protein n=1 Tax=Roseateles sp. NT4 TaxID=3453715 RepID=UPI003EEB5CD2